MGFNFSLGLGGISFGSSSNQPQVVNNYYGDNNGQQCGQGGGMQEARHHHHHHHHNHMDGMGQGQNGGNCMSNPLQQLLGPLTTGIQIGESLNGGGCDGLSGALNPMNLMGCSGGGGGSFAFAGNFC